MTSAVTAYLPYVGTTVPL